MDRWHAQFISAYYEGWAERLGLPAEQVAILDQQGALTAIIEGLLDSRQPEGNRRTG